MFALPNSKRVRRNELDSPSSSRASSPDADILAKLQARTQFDLIETPYTNTDPTDAAEAAEESEDELAFNLFAPTATTTTSTSANTTTTPTAPTQKIRIRSPTPLGDGNPGFIIPNRPLSHYLATTPSAQKAAEYAFAAVSGSTITDVWAKRPCPGCAYPWKVISVPSTASRAVLPSTATNAAEEKFLPEEGRERKRKRLGKKMRVKRRVKAEKARVKAVESERSKEEKERLDREKRARRNREKKFKKRARDKAKKAAGGGGCDGDDDEGDSDAGSGGEGGDSE